MEGKVNKVFNVAIVSSIFIAALSSAQAAPIYMAADFSGGILTTGGLANSLGLERTNTCSGCAAGSVSGHVLFDKSLIPGSGTGTVNIALGSLPGASSSAIFNIIFGSQPLGFEFGDQNVLGGPSIQFKDGEFNGFFFVEDFVVNGKTYELSMQGATWTMNWLKSNSSSDLVASGYLMAGDEGLAHQTYFEPAPSQLPVTAVPEPTGIALFVLGIWGIFMTRRREARSGSAHENVSAG